MQHGEWRAARRVIEAIAGPSLKQARVPSAQLRQPCELTRGRGVVVLVQLVRLRHEGGAYGAGDGQRSVLRPEEPSIDTVPVEGVPATRERAHRLAHLEVAEADDAGVVHEARRQRLGQSLARRASLDHLRVELRLRGPRVYRVKHRSEGDEMRSDEEAEAGEHVPAKLHLKLAPLRVVRPPPVRQSQRHEREPRVVRGVERRVPSHPPVLGSRNEPLRHAEGGRLRQRCAV
mmetsp:Transcript_25363/g.43327  ORF Transcript_25363/g.43327 Transcript_25363/m.43327 type:complete len:232 (-) Transcript_25363:476-1171(-)